MRFTRPPGSTELILVRHGESKPMRARPRLARRRSRRPGAGPDGRIQAELVGDGWPHLIDAITSTLRRTVETAAPLATPSSISNRSSSGTSRGPSRRVGGRALPQAYGRGASGRLRVLSEQRWDRDPRRVVLVPGRGALNRIVAANAGAAWPLQPRRHHRRDPRPRSPKSARPFAFLGAVRRVRPTSSCSVTWILRRFNDTSHLPAT